MAYNSAFEENIRGFLCYSCGERKSNKDSFYKCPSIAYQGNDHHIHICQDCLEKFYQAYLKKYNGDKKEAMRRVCMKIDCYYNEKIFGKIMRGRSVSSPVGKYIKAVFEDYSDMTFDNTLDEYLTAKSSSDSKKFICSPTIDDSVMERWGRIFASTEEYDEAEAHYKLLKKSNANVDSNQEIYIKDLTIAKVLQNRALRNNDLETYEKFTKVYQNTFKTSKLKLGVELNVENDDNAVWGRWLQTCEQFCPADVYKDKELFKDVDNIGSYFERFVLRPLRNYFKGSNEMDEEYDIEKYSDGEHGGDGDDDNKTE